jgi:hypothetical protein
VSEYEYDPDEWQDRVERFADPGGSSALHPATPDDPRDQPCGNCGWPNRLTSRDVARGYQCDACADAIERGHDIVPYTTEDAELDAAYDEVHGTITKEVDGGNDRDGR